MKTRIETSKQINAALTSAMESLRNFGGLDPHALFGRANEDMRVSKSAVQRFIAARVSDGTLRRIRWGVYAFGPKPVRKPRKPRSDSDLIGYQAGYDAGYRAALAMLVRN